MLRRLSRRELLEKCAALGGLTLAEPIGDPGRPLDVTGIVFSVRGEPLPGARIEVWQTDYFGPCDLEGYRYRATLAPDASGEVCVNLVPRGYLTLHTSPGVVWTAAWILASP